MCMKQILPILADIADGIFATLLAGWITNTEILWWHFLVGIPLAMMPDIDAVSELIRRGKASVCVEQPEDHRSGLHYPATFLVVGVCLIFLYPFYGTLFLCGAMLHFFNDLSGIGWGIPILWPFSDRRYKLFGRRVNRLKRTLVENGDWQKLPEDERRLRLVVSWSKEELHHYIVRWGMDEWIEPYYLTLNWTSAIEYALFALSLLLLVITLVS